MTKRTLAAALPLLGLTALAQAAPVAPSPTQKLVDAIQNVKTLSVDVTQSGPGRADNETLHFTLARPNKIKLIDLGIPSAGTLVSDGKTLYQWDAKQFVKRDAPAALSGINPAMPLGLAANIAGPLFTQPRPMIAALNLTDAGPDVVGGVRTHRLTAALPPGATEAPVTLWVADANSLPVQITLRGEGPPTTLVFKNYAVGKPVADAVFAATPPAGLVAYEPPQSPALLAAGTPAPDFTLSSLDGKSVSLSGLKGQAVLIDFWASWCGPCKMAMPHVQKIKDELGGKGLTVLSVNSWDKKDDMAAFLKAHPEYTTTLLFDPAEGDQSVATAKYKVSGIPTVYLIDKDGKVAASFVGYDPDGEAQIKAALAKLGVQ